MKRLLPEDLITDLTRYERVREQERRGVIALKKRRRVELGPRASLLFENRETVRFQIQEMIRIERMIDPGKIQAEIDVFNSILPDAGEVGATFMIEIDDPASLEREIEHLAGIERHLWLEIGPHRIRAVVPEGRPGASGLESVHYVRFPIDEDARSRLRAGGGAVAVEIDGPFYTASAILPEETVRELAGDLG